MPLPRISAALSFVAFFLVPGMAVSPPAVAEESASPDAAGLEPGHYTLKASGAVSAEGRNLPANDGDLHIDDEAILAGDASEKLVFTTDPMWNGTTNADGPYRLMLMLANEHVSVEGQDQAALQVSLHLRGDVAPGTYQIEDGFLDVGANAVPVAVMAAAASPDRSFTAAYSWNVNGTLELSELSTDTSSGYATGSFSFTAGELNSDGAITASGAFNRIPYTPGVALEAEIEGRLEGEGGRYDEVEASREEEGLRLRLHTGRSRGMSAVIQLSEMPEAKRYETGEGSPLVLKVDGFRATGHVEFTRTEGSYAGSFKLDARGTRADYQLSGTFDHVPVPQ